MKPLVLASSSIYRQQLLERLKIPFSHCAAKIDESPITNENATSLATRLSLQKAQSQAHKLTHHLIIGCDQVAEFGNKIIGKAGNFSTAYQQLKSQSGRNVVFHSGLCLLDSTTGNYQLDTITTEVTFRKLSDYEIERYLKQETPYDCAGSFKCEGLGISLFEAIKCTDPTALIGLPLIRLCEMLRNEGIQRP